MSASIYSGMNFNPSNVDDAAPTTDKMVPFAAQLDLVTTSIRVW
jgi:hypothetical protein